MSEYENLLLSDQDSNDAIDHIPKTPGPVTVNERDSEEEEDEENEDDDRKSEENKVKSEASLDHSDGDSEVESEKSDDEEVAQRRNTSDNDSEVERSEDERNEQQSHDEEDDEDDEEEKKPVIDSTVNHDEESKSEKGESDNESKSENEEDEVQSKSESESPKRKRSFPDESSESGEDVKTSESKRLRVESEGEESEDEKNLMTSTKEIFGELSSEEEQEAKAKVEKKEEESDSDAAGNDSSMRNDSAKMENDMQDGENVFYDEEQQEEPIPETRIDVEIPRIVAGLGQEINFVKLPNFLSVDTHPYDPSWYDEEGLDEEEGGYDDEGRARIKLKVENTMRWRNVVDANGNTKKESNSRIVRWSDGSMSLHLGQEIFDIYKQQLMPGDNNHLFIRQGTGLQGQAVFRTKLTFRPHSTDSFTHRKMTLSLADRSQKTQKIRVLPTVGKDPEAHRSEMIKKEEDRLKASIRRENKMRRIRERANVRGPTASYLEPDQYDDEDDEGAISLSAIKNKYKKGGAAYNVYTDSEGSDDDSDLDIFDKKKSSGEAKKKPKIVEESDED